MISGAETKMHTQIFKGIKILCFVPWNNAPKDIFNFKKILFYSSFVLYDTDFDSK